MSFKAIQAVLKSDLPPRKKLQVISNVVDAMTKFLEECNVPSDGVPVAVASASAIDRNAVVSTIERGVRWLLEDVHADGGWGWPVRKRVPFAVWSRSRAGTRGEPASLPWDTAMATLALTQWDRFRPGDRAVARAIDRGRKCLERCQQSDGGWGGLLRMRANSASNTAETAITLWVMRQAGDRGSNVIRRALSFLARVRNADGGWGLEPGQPSDPKSTATVVGATYVHGPDDRTTAAAEWLIANQQPAGNWVMPSRLAGGVDPTFYAMSALMMHRARTKDERARESVARALAWYRRTADFIQHGGEVGWGWGTTENTAAGVASLLNCDEPDTSADVEKGVEWLISQHHPRSAWRYDTPVTIFGLVRYVDPTSRLGPTLQRLAVTS